MELYQKHCTRADGKIPALSADEIRERLAHIPEWSLGDGAIQRDLKFRDFREALHFVNRIGELAEAEAHHPDIQLHSWNRVRLTLSTHSIHGLSENDFILAAKIDRLPDVAPPSRGR
jgi:4a-hydroxytetrahydrobiopterin dehydratase